METSDTTKQIREAAAFFVAATAFTWLFWAAAWLGQTGVFALPVTPLLRIGTFVPSAAGLIAACRFGGKEEARALFAALFDPHIEGKWMLFIFGVPAGVSALSCLVFALFGGSLPEPQIELQFIPFAFLYVLIFLGPLGEEAGWRGFALKRLLAVLSPMKSALVVGVVWACWHLPLFFIDGTTQHALAEFGLPAALACYLLYTAMVSVLLTLIYIMTGGNTLAAALYHAAANLSLGVVPLISVKSGAAILLPVLGAVTAGFTYRYRKLYFVRIENGHSNN